MLNIFKHKPKMPLNPWRKVDAMWDRGDFDPENIEYPDNTRIVDLQVNNGNVGHGMKGFYYGGEWFTDEWRPERGTIFRTMNNGVTVVGWCEL